MKQPPSTVPATADPSFSNIREGIKTQWIQKRNSYAVPTRNPTGNLSMQDQIQNQTIDIIENSAKNKATLAPIKNSLAIAQKRKSHMNYYGRNQTEKATLENDTIDVVDPTAAYTNLTTMPDK